MKIAWFSPLLPDHSDIANFTARLRSSLESRFEIRYLTERAGGFFEPSTEILYPGKLGSCPHDLIVSLNAGDVPIYNLGNNPVFFAQTWFLNQFKPGIVILHDTKVHHFFEGIYCEKLRDEKSYLDAMQDHYGPLGRRAGFAYCRSNLSIDFMAEHFPMTAWATRNALGVVVHTPYAYEAVRRVTSTPVWMIPLPYEPRPSVGAANLIEPSTEFRLNFSAGQRVKIVIFGYLNTNRRIIEFLHALATMPESDFFEVHVIGTISHEREVNEAVDALGLRSRVSFHGYVPDNDLEEMLDSVDLAINLRYPTMGEASGSQLRIWDHALPSLVTRTEGYASLPPDAVFFVRPEHERVDIQRHLRHFLRQPDFFREAGRRGRRHLLDHHLPTMYADALHVVCTEAAALRSRHNRLWLADRVGITSSPWATGMPFGDRERFYATRIAETV